MPPQDPEAARWFSAHVQPHEPQLRAWLTSQFSTAQDIDDIVQEAFVRVLRAWEAAELRSPKAYLFVIARNLALMRVRHAKVAKEESLAETDCSDILDEGADVPHAVARAQELEMLTEAIQSLPTRCRQILTLRKIYGLSQKETAAELGIAEHTVEIQTAIGLKKIGQFFRRYRAQA
jgi:RNA polymerase sigma factor (sigma-70 family)